MKNFASIFLMLGFTITFQVKAQKLDFIMDMVHHNPGEKPYQTKYTDAFYLKSMGFNSMVIMCHINTAITYDNFKKNTIPKNSEERKWIEQKALTVDTKLKNCKDAGINAFTFIDFLVFPKTIWDKYGKEIRIADFDSLPNEKKKEYEFKPDIQRPLTQTLLRAQIKGLFERFPSLDGIVLRFGETYLHDTPFHRGGSPVSVTDDRQSIKDHILLISILREEVCVKRNKKLFYRTWDFGYRFHTNPEYYLAVTNAIEPHPNLFFSIKYQQGDFHRMTPFNPCLGIGKHRQIVESQSRMEAYGKGAHPYYTGQGVINGWPETKYEISMWTNSFTGKLNPPDSPRGIKDIVKSGLLAGVWTWSHGGGWQGPYIKNEIWTDLNTYVVSHWGLDISKTEEQLFHEFATSLGLSGWNVDIFRQLNLLTIEAVRKGQLNSYTENAVWWARDEFFSTGYNENSLKKILKSNLQQKVLAEKAEASAIWQQIEELSQQLEMNDTVTLSAIRTSCIYGRIKYQLIEQMWILMIEDASNKITGSYHKSVITAALSRYDELWTEWRLLQKSSPYCATLYTEFAFRNKKEGSVGELIERLRKL